MNPVWFQCEARHEDSAGGPVRLRQVHGGAAHTEVLRPQLGPPLAREPRHRGAERALGQVQAQHRVPGARPLQQVTNHNTASGHVTGSSSLIGPPPQNPGREHRLRGQQQGALHGGHHRRRQEGKHPSVHIQPASRCFLNPLENIF